MQERGKEVDLEKGRKITESFKEYKEKSFKKSSSFLFCFVLLLTERTWGRC